VEGHQRLRGLPHEERLIGARRSGDVPEPLDRVHPSNLLLAHAGPAAVDGGRIAAQVAALHLRVVAHLLGSAVGDHPAGLQRQHPARQAQHERQVVLVRAGPWRPSARSPARGGCGQLLHLALGQTGRGLVEQQHPRVQGQRAHELAHATGAGGQLGDQRIRVPGQAERPEQLVRLATTARPRPGARPGCGAARPTPAPGGRAAGRPSRTGARSGPRRARRPGTSGRAPSGCAGGPAGR